MIVWTWDAAGQAREGAGVADDPARARESAEQFMAQAGAPSARVERVTVDIGRATLAGSYAPTGRGWTASLAGGLVTWTAFRPAAGAS